MLKEFGIKSRQHQYRIGVLNEEGYFNVAKKLKEIYNFKAVAITLRKVSPHPGTDGARCFWTKKIAPHHTDHQDMKLK
ncbi:MAG: hypothetical protein MZW92_25805 [Comamonadaceae bacterium]|nr:hypothetical protein [Comamonadaceae bacterium]